MPAIFQSDIFWSAFGALVTFAALVGSIGGVIIAMLKRGKWRRLQTKQDRERKFYEEHARRVTPDPIWLPEEYTIDQYLQSIQNGLLAIAQLPDEQRDRTKDKIRSLISQLRATHATLVKALKPFTTNDAKKFFEEFDKFNQDFGELYDTGNVPHNARTHCDDVVQIVNDLVPQLAGDRISAQYDQVQSEKGIDREYTISSIASSMEQADKEVIVPIMRYILSKTEVELSLINSAIRDRNKDKAIWLKERYRFEIKDLYKRLDDALTRMDDLASKL